MTAPPVLLRKAGTAYAVVRAVRLLQARGALPGHRGLEVAGRHVHHYAWGVLLLLLQVRLTGPLRANVLCTGAALVLDELDVATGTQSGRWRPARVVADLAGLVALTTGAVHWRTTWSGWYPRNS